MIKIGVLAGDGRYYQRDTSPGAYYGAATGGVAAGGAAAAAGLGPAVSAAELDNLLAGRSADGTRELVRPHPHRKKGCEIHAAPDKSVSALFAVAPLAVAYAIVAASEAALRPALRQAEAECGVTRRGKAGRTHERGELAFVIYTHYTSRAGDPQLHHHVVVPNLVRRPDGTWGAHHNRLLYKAQKRLTATYNRALRDNLVALGIDARLENGRCVVAGVPRALCEAFSTRRKEVVAAKGDFHPKDRDAAQKAAWATRGRKLKTPEAELRAGWRAVAQTHGYDPMASVLRTPTTDQLEAVRRAAEAAYPSPGGRVALTPKPATHSVVVRPTDPGQDQARTKTNSRDTGGTNRPRPDARIPVPPRTGVFAPEPARSPPPSPIHQPAKPVVSRTPQGTSTVSEHRPADGPALVKRTEPGARVRESVPSRPRVDSPTTLTRTAVAAATKPLFHRSPERLARRAVQKAVAELASTFAHFELDQVEKRSMSLLKLWVRHEAGAEQETAPALSAVLQNLHDRPKAYGLTVLPHGTGYATTRQWKLEHAVAQDLKRLEHGRARKALKPSAVHRKLTRTGLTAAQRGTVTGVVCSPSRLALVDGVGRTGKTAVAQEVCAAFARAGRNVYAVSGTARGAAALVADTVTRPLTVTGFNLLTRRPGMVETWKLVYRAVLRKQFKKVSHMARYAEAVHRRLQEPPISLGRNSVIVVDDAHRVATADLAPLLRRARKAGAKVVLVGDAKGPIPACPAGVFAHAVRTSPAVALPPEPLTAEPAVRDAVRHLAAGAVERAIQSLRTDGGVSASDRPRTQLLGEYQRGGHLAHPEKVAILTASDREAASANDAVQRLRRAAGHLGTRGPGDGCEVAVGDRVLIPRANRRAKIPAYSRGTLVSVGPFRHRVRLDDGRKVNVKAAGSPLRLAYALGPSAAAGHAFDRAFVLLAPLRSHDQTVPRLPNRDQALAMLARVSGRATTIVRSRDLASGDLVKALGRSRRPVMAIDAVEASRLRVQPQIPRPEQTQLPRY